MDFASRDKEEQVNALISGLVDTALYEHVVPERDRIEAVAKECFNVNQRDYQAAFLAFTYQIPDKVPQACSETLKALTDIFDTILYQLSTQD
ncbi:hypothetical protein M9Y10_030993 [Tritrichomonas musculus]|uniref:Uncharacterized protein n=1 Tax=Tritrichomonas musculus TaxID=1915356 RepID=A0ABR2H1M3_9EUKA